jgi:tetratricopeptide (TPR) repeat protein
MTGSSPPALCPRPARPFGSAPRAALLTALLAVLLAVQAAAGCATKTSPVATAPAAPMRARDQAAASPDIAAVAAAITGRDDAERICRAMRYVGENLAYDPEGNPEQFTKTAAELFQDKILGGCSDFALAEMALIRAMGFKTHLALTANVKWIKLWRENPLAVGNGHSFIEVFLDGRWHLVDPTYFILYDGYDPNQKNLPSGEIAMARGDDFAALGIASVDQANDLLGKAAAAYADDYRDPGLPVRCQVDFDFPATFARLGELFLEKGVLPSALRLCRKAVELDPGRKDAQLCLARARLRSGDRTRAAAALDALQKLDPANPDIPALRRELDKQ